MLSERVNGRRKILSAAVAAASALALQTVAVQAATDTWTGSASNLWSGANWTGGNTPPVDGDTVVFTGSSTNLATSNDLTLSLGGLTFNTGAAAYAVSGNALALTGALTDNAVGVTQVFNVAVNGTAASSLAIANDNSAGESLTLNAGGTFGSITVKSFASTANTVGIASGQTLNINGTAATVIGPGQPATGTNTSVLNLVGGGSYNQTNGNLTVSLTNGSNTLGDAVATMDATQLANFTYNNATGTVAVGFGAKSFGTLRLANTVGSTNLVKAATLTIGDSNNGNNSAGTSLLALGGNATNTINAGTINIGAGKAAGQINFNGAGGSVTIAGTNGGATTANITVGRMSSASGTNTQSQLALAGHTATVQAGTVIVGQLNGSSGNSGGGIISFDTGTFTASSIRLAVDTSGNNALGTRGTFTLGSAGSTGVLNATTFTMGDVASGSSTTARPNTTTFTIAGGTANIGSNITINNATANNVTATATVNLTGGTLNMGLGGTTHSIGTVSSGTGFTNNFNFNMPGANQTATIMNLGGTGITTTANPSGGLLMSGAGTLIVGGTNDFTGATTINNATATMIVTGALPAAGNVTLTSGSLAGAGNGTTTGKAGNLTMAAGTNLRPGATAADGNVGTLTLASLTANGGDLRFDLTGTGAGQADQIAVAGNVNFAAATTVSVSPVGLAVGTYPIITSTGLTGLGNLTLQQSSVGRSTLALGSSGNNVTLTVGGGAANLVWRGDDGTSPGLWDVQTTQNWNNLAGPNPDKFYDADNVTFDSSSANRTVTLNATAMPGSVNFTHTGNYTFAGTGAIGGSAAVSITGGGTVVMPLVNTYTGATTITNGSTLEVSTLAAAGTASGIGAATNSASNLVLDNGTLKWTGAATQTSTRGFTIGTGGATINASSPTAAQAITISGPIAYSGSGARTLTLAGTEVSTTAIAGNTIQTIISDGAGGATSLVKSGNVGWALQAANTYTGGTTISAGRLRANAAGALGTGAVTISNGGQLWVTSASTFNNPITLQGIGVQEGATPGNFGALRVGTNNANIAGLITLAADARITGRGATTGGNITGKITGAHAVEFNYTQTSTDILIISNVANDWTFDTTISAGVLKAGASSVGSGGVIPHGAGKGNVIINGDPTPFDAIFDVNGNNVVVNGLTTSGDAAHAIVTSSAGQAGTLTVGDNDASSTFAGILRDGAAPNALSFAKIGAGTQTLSGSNTYTGTTTVSQGTLVIASTGSIANSNTISVSSGATLDVSAFSPFSVGNSQKLHANGTVTGAVAVFGTLGGTGTMGSVATGGSAHVNPGATSSDGSIGTLTMSSLDVNGGDFRLDLTSGGGDAINVTGAANFNNPSSISVAPGYAAGTYTILTAGTLNLTNPPTAPVDDGRVHFALNTGTPNTLKLVITGSPLSLTWNNAGATGDGATWDVQNNQNWKNPANDVFFNNDTVTFNDANNGNYNVTVGATVSPTAVTVNNSGGAYTFSGGGSISGAATLTKLGTSGLTVTNSNTYSGGTTISAGVVNANAASALGTGAVTLAGGTLNIGNASALAGTQAINVAASGGTLDNTTGGALSASNAVNLTGNLTYVGTNDLTLAGVVGGTGGLVKNGATTLVLSGANTYAGPVTINNGVVKGTAAVFGTAAGGVTINGSGTYDINNAPLGTAEQFTLNGNGLNGDGQIVNTAGTGTASNNIAKVTLAGDSTIGGTQRWDLRGNTPVLDLATHTLTKKGANQISMVAGTIQSTGGAGNIDIASGIWSMETTTTLQSNATVTYEDGTVAQFFRNSGNGTTTGLMGKLVVNGAVDMGNAETTTTNLPASVFSPIELHGNLTLVPLNSGARATGVTAPGTILAGNITNGDATPRNITKIGGDTVTLSGVVSNTGTTTVSAGSLVVGNNMVGSSQLAIDGATTSVKMSPNASHVIKTGSVAITNSAKLDLTDNKLIVSGAAAGSTYDGTAYQGLVAQVVAGRNGGAWTGSGIITSLTDAVGAAPKTSLGTASADALGRVGQTFAGQVLSSGDMIVMYTYGGDANLDGKLNGDDYFAIDSHVSATGSNVSWNHGDFNYNGKVDGDDYFILDQNIAAGGPAFPTSGGIDGEFPASGGVSGISAVPEPASLGLLSLAACGLATRRRRRSRTR